MNKLIVAIGLLIILAGLFWKYLLKIPFFHLPGDIVIDKPHFKFYFPITTMILFSLLLSILFWLIKKFF